MATIPKDTVHAVYVRKLLWAITERVEQEKLSLDAALAQLNLSIKELTSIAPELSRIITATENTANMTDEECVELANELDESVEDLIEQRAWAASLQKTMEIGQALLKRQAIPKAEKAPNPWDENDNAPVVDNKVVNVIGQALAAGGRKHWQLKNGWRENTVNKHPLFDRTTGKDSIQVYLEPESYNAAELWAKVNNLDSLTLDVYLAILVLVCDPRNRAASPHFGWFTVNPAQIADMKAFRRYGNDRRVLIGKIVEAIHTISDLRTDFVIPWPGHGKKDQKRIARETGCRLIHVGGVTYIEQGELFEHPNEFPKDKQVAAVKIFIGLWGNYWLRDGDRYYWVAVATRKLMELDYNPTNMGDIFAKKIGMLLLTVDGGTDSRNKTLEFTIEKLLQEIQELPEAEYRGKRTNDRREGQNWANRTAEYLQAGLTTLLQIGMLASYNVSSDYPSPGDRGATWSERWLSAKVYLTTPEAAALMPQLPPQAIPDVPERKRRVRGLGKTKKPLARGQYLDATTVAAIYETYKERNWTQQSLAWELKIARPTLSNVLNRREAPSAELAKRIRAFLDSPPPD